MILVIRNRNKIWMKGHALFDEYGKDIVCSSVSSIFTTTINGILKLNQEAITYQVLEDEVQIEIKSQDEVTLKLIDNMIELLTELSQQYPKNIRVKEGV